MTEFRKMTRDQFRRINRLPNPIQEVCCVEIVDEKPLVVLLLDNELSKDQWSFHLQKDDLLHLAKSILRYFDPTTEDQILETLREIEKRLDSSD